jgi:hypothetical protein
MSRLRHRLQFIHPRRFDELSKEQSRGVVSWFCLGAFNGVLIGLLPVLLIVGALNYLANGWHDFGRELLEH